MTSSPTFSGENLQELCDKFCQEYMLNSWTSVFKTLSVLHDGLPLLPKSCSRIYTQKCMNALRILIKNMQTRDLNDYVQKLILPPKYQLEIIVSGLRSEWPKCHGNEIVEAFVLAAKTATASQIDALGLVAKSLVDGNIRYVQAEDQEKDTLKSSEEQESLLIPTSAPNTVFVLVLMDGIPLKDEPVIKLRRNLFEQILPQDLGTSSPLLALKLITNFIEDEYKLLHFDRTGTNLLLKYLGYCKTSINPFPFSVFLEFAKSLSVALKDSHNILYDEIKLHTKGTSLSQAEKQKLEHLVNCATLSSDRLKEVILSGFSCAIRDVALALVKENGELKDHIRKKRPRDCSCSCPHDEQTPSKISRDIEEGEVENDMLVVVERSQVSGLDA